MVVFVVQWQALFISVDTLPTLHIYNWIVMA